MTERFLHSTTASTGGLAFDAWFRKYAENCKFLGDDLVEAETLSGEKKMVRAAEAVIVCKLEGEKKAQRGSKIAFEYKPGRTMLFDECFYAQNVSRTMDTDRTLLFPLGTINPADSKTSTVMSQTGVDWSSGNSYNIKASDELTTNAYMGMLKCLVYNLASEKSLSKQKAEFVRTLLVARAAFQFYLTNTTCQKILQALVSSAQVNDVLHQVIGAAMVNTNMTRKFTYTIISTAIKRQTKYGKSNLLDGMSGPLAVLVIGPMLQQALHHDMKSADCQAAFNTKVMEIADYFSKVPSTLKNNTDIDVAILKKLLELRNFAVNEDGLRKLVVFCRNKDNFFKAPDFEGWGLVDARKTTFKVTTTGLKSIGKPSIGCNIIDVDEHSDVKDASNSIRVQASDGTKWNPFAVSGNGTFTVTDCVVVGLADVGKGDIRRKELQAAWRVSGEGDDCLAEFVHGYSTTGKERRTGWKGTSKWEYADVEAVDIFQPVTILATATQIAVVQDGKRFATLPRRAGNDIIFGLKSVAFTLTKTSDSAVIEELEAKKPDAPAETLAKSDLAPTALLEQLAQLAIKEKEKEVATASTLTDATDSLV